MDAFEEAFVDKGIAIGEKRGEKRGFKNGRDKTLKENFQNLKMNLLETGMCKTEDEAAEMAAMLLRKTNLNLD